MHDWQSLSHVRWSCKYHIVTVPSISFKVLYVFFIIDYARRKVVHFNVTMNPTAEWVIQQLKNAFPFENAPRY